MTEHVLIPSSIIGSPTHAIWPANQSGNDANKGSLERKVCLDCTVVMKYSLTISDAE